MEEPAASDALEYYRDALATLTKSVRARFQLGSRFSSPHFSSESTDAKFHSDINDEIATVQSTLHETISELSSTFGKVIQELSSRKNAAVQINRLPRNILHAIFDYAGERGHEMAVNIAMSHTCAYWRELLISNSTLWTCYTFLDSTGPFPSWVLERSRDACLELRNCCDQRQLNVHFITLFCKHRLRVRNLIIAMNTKSYQWSPSPTWDWLTCLVSPRLEYLDICAYGAISDSLISLSTTICSPALTSLRLSGYRLPWRESNYSHLQTLTIDVSDGIGNHDTDILLIFRGSPKLRRCVLRCTAPIHRDTDVTNTRSNPIPLRCLQYLELRLQLSSVAYILSNISTPAYLVSNIEGIVHRDIRKTQCASLLPSDPKCFPSINLLRCLTISLTSSELLGSFQDTVTPHFRIHIAVDSSVTADRGRARLQAIAARVVASSLRQISETHSFLHLHNLSLHDLPDADFGFLPEEISHFLWRVPSIEALGLHQCSLALTNHIFEESNHSAMSMVPQLTSLILAYDHLDLIKFRDFCQSLTAARAITLNVRLYAPVVFEVENVEIGKEVFLNFAKAEKIKLTPHREKLPVIRVQGSKPGGATQYRYNPNESLWVEE